MERGDSEPSMLVIKPTLRDKSGQPKLEDVLLIIFVRTLSKLREAMVLECLCCRHWLSRELPPPFQLETAVQTAPHTHLDLDTEDLLVPVEVMRFGRVRTKSCRKKYSFQS